MQRSFSIRTIASLFIAAILPLSGALATPASASDDKGLGLPTSITVSITDDGEAFTSQVSSSDTWVYREHTTANHERVDLRDDRIDKVWTLHKVNFTALTRVVEWARSPRKATGKDGIDRGIYEYRIYEYESVNGNLQKTGRWVIIKTVIEWGDGYKDRGWMVTAYPVLTDSGKPPQTSDGKTYCPAWLANATVVGPVNNDVLY